MLRLWFDAGSCGRWSAWAQRRSNVVACNHWSHYLHDSPDARHAWRAGRCGPEQEDYPVGIRRLCGQDLDRCTCHILVINLSHILEIGCTRLCRTCGYWCCSHGQTVGVEKCICRQHHLEAVVRVDGGNICSPTLQRIQCLVYVRERSTNSKNNHLVPAINIVWSMCNWSHFLPWRNSYWIAEEFVESLLGLV